MQYFKAFVVFVAKYIGRCMTGLALLITALISWTFDVPFAWPPDYITTAKVGGVFALLAVFVWINNYFQAKARALIEAREASAIQLRDLYHGMLFDLQRAEVIHPGIQAWIRNKIKSASVKDSSPYTIPLRDVVKTISSADP